MTDQTGAAPQPTNQPHGWAQPHSGQPQSPALGGMPGGYYPQPVATQGYYLQHAPQPGHGQPRYNSLAIAGFVLALVPILAPLGQLLGVIFGHIARRQIRRTGERGAGFALAALLIGYIGGALTILLLIGSIVLSIFLAQAHAEELRAVRADVRATVKTVEQYRLSVGESAQLPQTLVVKTGGSGEHIVITGDSDDYVVLGSSDLIGPARSDAYYYSSLTQDYAGYGEFETDATDGSGGASDSGDSLVALQRGAFSAQKVLLR